MQQQAGYILESVHKTLMDHYSKMNGGRLSGLLRQLSYFDIEESLSSEEVEVNPLVYVYSNLISRGLPTYSSIYLEEEFSKLFGKTKLFTENEPDQYDKYKYSVSYLNHDFNNEFEKLLFRAIHIIDPRYSLQDIKEGLLIPNFSFGSDHEKVFFNSMLKDVLGEHAFQIVKGQQNLEHLLRFSPDETGELDKAINGAIDSFSQQDLDYIYEFPSPQSDAKLNGIIIEIDGSQHQEEGQSYIDKLRNDALTKSNRRTFRIATSEFNRYKEVFKKLTELRNTPYIKTNEYNYLNSLFKEHEGTIALQFALSPIAIARIQKVLLNQIKKGILDINSIKWKIGIVERDIPAAHLAIQDFKRTFNHLLELDGNSLSLPEIELSVYSNKEFINSELNSLGHVEELKEAENFEGDILIDTSVLLRSSLRHCKIENNKVKNYIQIYSSNNIESKRYFDTDELIEYSNAPKNLEDKNIEHLNFFLQTITRFSGFKDGQVEIINLALNGESVIGLLPTGGGKSITYQICSLLQPGITIVIDPIKSLMQDQYEGLMNKLIDSAQFINSSIRIPFIRERRQEKLEKGECLINFVSPERLQIKRFRESLLNMHSENHVYFSYCVIDEAHCVSEWGHDFRTAYLKLGENAREYCKIKNPDKTIPLFGLTATASFDVLADVKRELQLDDKNVVKEKELSNREELNFVILKSSTSTEMVNTDYKLRQAVGKGKHEAITDFISNLPYEIEKLNEKYSEKGQKEIAIRNYDAQEFYNERENSKYENAVLIFCPYKKATTNFGVESIANLLKKEDDLALGTFYAPDNDKKDNSQEAEFMANQSKFIKNKLNVLVATKAFGMGIDKPNVRATIHLNYPSSIEAFVQEAGRAGRDRKSAICAIVFSDQPELDKDILKSFHSNSFKGIEKETAILFELLNEITYPVESASNSISRYVLENSGVSVSFSLYTPPNSPVPIQLYVNKGFQDGFGCLDLKANFRFNTNKSNYNRIESESILGLVKNFLIKNDINAINISTWLKVETEIEPEPGIEVRLNNINEGEPLPGDIVVGFRNNRIWKITKYLQNEVEDGGGYTEAIVKSSSKFTKDPIEFITNLIKKHRKAYDHLVDIPEEHHEILRKWFTEIRDESDTYKAIYRLSVIKVIDDYEIDYNKKCLYIKVNKRKTDDEYIENLRAYYLRYKSREEVSKRMDNLPNVAGNSIMQKCLADLTDFVYSAIADKRLSAIGSMEQACIRGLQDPEDMRKSIKTYFDSKYVDDIRKDTKDGIDADPEVLWDYLERTDGIVDNLEHLLGSSRRMLDDRPDNPVFILMQCFSIFLLYTRIEKSKLIIKNDELINSARKDFVKGINRFDTLGEDTEQILTKFKQEILKHNRALDDFISSTEEEIWIKIHADWLDTFNNKFYNYERN